jgi:hypothetical protein
MISKKQARRIFKMSQNSKNTQSKMAFKTDTDVKTVRKYLKIKKLPDEIKPIHNWKTRENPFEKDWDEIKEMLGNNQGLESKTILEYLNSEYNNKYSEGQLRTLQRKVKIWKAIEGPGNEVYFPQIHKPGVLCESDFTSMNKLKIKIKNNYFPHLIYHFVLTYSNWETGYICFSESFESLSEGFQNAIWELGGTPKKHRTDRLTTAVYNSADKSRFQTNYIQLLNHYSITGEKTQAASPNENGDVEQRHYRFKKAVDQQLMLRGSRNFQSIQDYSDFIKGLFKKLNKHRQIKLQEELKTLSALPTRRRESCREILLKVGSISTINVLGNTYSVHNRLIGEKIKVKIYISNLEIWYAQKCVEKIPRLKSSGNRNINYRHIIDWLIRKPGAFINYKYQKDMFPSTRFRIAYDSLMQKYPDTGHKKYLKILHLAAKEGEAYVEKAILFLIQKNKKIVFEEIKKIVSEKNIIKNNHDVVVDILDIKNYDNFLEKKMKVCYA